MYVKVSKAMLQDKNMGIEFGFRVNEDGFLLLSNVFVYQHLFNLFMGFLHSSAFLVSSLGKGVDKSRHGRQSKHRAHGMQLVPTNEVIASGRIGNLGVLQLLVQRLPNGKNFIVCF